MISAMRKPFKTLLLVLFFLANSQLLFAEESQKMTIQYDPNPPTEVNKAQARQLEVAKITYLSENVMVQRQGSTKPLPAKSDMPLFASDIILTLSPDSRAEITFNNGHVTRLGGVSKLIIESVKGTGSAQQSVLNLLNGQVLIEVQKLDKQNPQNTFQIKTPVSISAVKGTKFLTTYEKDQTEIKVTEGLVQVSNSSGQVVDVPAGYKTALSSGQKPSTPQQLTAADLESMSNLEKETRPKSWLRRFFPDNQANQKSINPRFFHLQGP
jgi:hypothetical protein